ncbi:SDR family NAD(P)-dependent oxidoreductase, partial [Nocardia wallacei]|uniref:SDR family NAD(P)-dependent oxidoreductase n=1 Tax=Nocardia wallacei TaxID=480035 RepID=UPI0024578F5C
MTTQKTLAGRVAVVTGASSGIGAATAQRLAAAGARVAVLPPPAGRHAHQVGRLPGVEQRGDAVRGVDGRHRRPVGPGAQGAQIAQAADAG